MRRVVTTFPNRERALAAVSAALGEHLTACAHMIPVDPRYGWKEGRIRSGSEAMVLFRTVLERVGTLFRFMAEHRPYWVPEIIELEVLRAAPEYLSSRTTALDRASLPPSGRRRVTRPAGR